MRVYLLICKPTKYHSKNMCHCWLLETTLFYEVEFVPNTRPTTASENLRCVLLTVIEVFSCCAHNATNKFHCQPHKSCVNSRRRTYQLPYCSTPSTADWSKSL